MVGPSNTNSPFFAYGIFQAGELAFLSIRDLVDGIPKPAEVKGRLRLRDGLPILDPNGDHAVQGSLIFFGEGKQNEAYERINRLEPEEHYRWAETSAHGEHCNYLVGRSPNKGSDPLEEVWDGKKDPLFTSALDVVEETLENNRKFESDLKPTFRLQMAYLLLWSSIERYASLRYHLGGEPYGKVVQIASDPKFGELLRQHAKDKRCVQRADRPTQPCRLDPEIPRKSLEYYYQVRSNIVHRGKAVWRDHDTVLKSLSELLNIFRRLLQYDFESSGAVPQAAHSGTDKAAGNRDLGHPAGGRT